MKPTEYYFFPVIPGAIILALLLTLTLACSVDSPPVGETPSPLERLPENEAGMIVKKAIEQAGGWAAWADKESFSFYKNIEYLDSAGQVERSVRQLHQYRLHPQFKARISWAEGGAEYVIINNGIEAKKFKNGEEMTDKASKNQAWNSSFGSHYVVTIPFKLTDPGVLLSYEGIDTLDNGQAVHALKVDYEKGAGSAGGMHHWWYYFSLDHYDLAGNFLDYGDKYSFTTYESFEQVGDLRVHLKRHSYLSNAAKEMVQLRTIYTNENMSFNEASEAALYVLK